MIRVLYIFTLLAGALTAHAEELQWVVKNGLVTGCAAKTAAVKPKPQCANLPFVPLECIQAIARDKIADNRKCAELIGTSYRWLDSSADTCGEFARVTLKGKTAFLLLGTTERSNCGYHWLAVQEKSGTCAFTDAGAFQFHPLGQLGLDKLVPEILKLAENEEIPKEVFQKYGSREIGASLAFKVYEEKEKNLPPAARDPYDFLDDTEIQIAFFGKNFDGIQARGFLNQYQTGNSQGTLDLSKRIQVESALVGRQLSAADDKMKEVLPKYAYLTPTADKETNLARGHRYFSVYGNILAALKPSVKDRITFTPFDSLVDHTLKVYSGKAPPGGHTLRAPQDGLVSYRSEAEMPRFYWEAQIWGELTVQQDVSYFLWNCFAEDKAGEAELVKLKASGKPVYECIAEGTSGQAPVRFRRGKQL